MVSIQNKIREILQAAPVLGSVEAQIVMYDAYETTYGIHDHAHHSDDMALIRWRPAEDIEAFDPTTERMVMYYNANVLKYSGITFDCFMELPRHRQETIALACQEVMRLELEEQKRQAERLEEEKRKIQSGKV